MAIRLRRLLFGARHIAHFAPRPKSLARLGRWTGNFAPLRWMAGGVLDAGWLPPRQQSTASGVSPADTVLVLIPNPHHDATAQLQFARSLGANVRAIHVDQNPEQTRRLLWAWARSGANVPLLVLEGDGLPVPASLRAYLALLTHGRTDGKVSLVLPVCESGSCRAKITCVLRGIAARLLLSGVPGVRVYGGGLAPARSERELVGCAAEA